MPNPLDSEDAAFRFLVRAVGVIVALIVVLVLVRAIL